MGRKHNATAPVGNASVEFRPRLPTSARVGGNNLVLSAEESELGGFGAAATIVPFAVGATLSPGRMKLIIVLVLGFLGFLNSFLSGGFLLLNLGDGRWLFGFLFLSLGLFL